MGCKNPSGISVSIHAPTRGATRKEFESLTDKEFQSTHPHGVRLAPVLSFSGFAKFQSTHPHGVRHVIDEALEAVAGFNPRTHTGCDLPVMSGVSSLSSFQSTHPHGVRRLTQVMSLITLMFQSTHPHGVRRSIFMGMYRPRPGFNPRTHTGCDLSLISHYSHHLSFNPRTHTGCDLWNVESEVPYTGFNPRTHTGCDSL